VIGLQSHTRFTHLFLRYIQNLSIALFHSSFPSIHTQSLNYLVHIVLEASCAREAQRRCVNYRPEVKRMGGQKIARALKRGGEGGGRRRERETCLLRNRCTAAPRAALYGSAIRGEEHSRRGTTTTGDCVRARVWLRGGGACLSPALVPLFLVDVGWTDDGSDEGACAEASISRCQWA